MPAAIPAGALRTLSARDREVVRACLACVARGDVIKHDHEFGPLFGMQPRAFVALLRRWPELDDADEAVFLAINGALNSLLGYPHAHHDDWDCAIGVPKPLVARVFKKWRKLRDARAAQPTPARLIAALAAAPRLFARAQRALTITQLNTRIDADDWSINDLLAHLRACADVWGGSIDAMLERDHPTLRYVSPRGWMRKSGYQTLAFDASLKAYARQRKALIARLRALSPEAWARGAMFTGTTLGRQQTVALYVARICAHEQEHCGQLERVIGALS